MRNVSYCVAGPTLLFNWLLLRFRISLILNNRIFINSAFKAAHISTGGSFFINKVQTWPLIWIFPAYSTVFTGVKACGSCTFSTSASKQGERSCGSSCRCSSVIQRALLADSIGAQRVAIHADQALLVLASFATQMSRMLSRTRLALFICIQIMVIDTVLTLQWVFWVSLQTGRDCSTWRK